MKPIPYIIKEALDVNEGDNPMAKFLCNYYRELLNKANVHNNQVVTNRDSGFIELHKKYGDSLE